MKLQTPEDREIKAREVTVPLMVADGSNCKLYRVLQDYIDNESTDPIKDYPIATSRLLTAEHYSACQDPEHRRSIERIYEDD